MGRNSTFKKRRHSYKVALALEIRLRVIATNFVILSCNLHELVRTPRAPWHETHASAGFDSSGKNSTKFTHILIYI
jgi:hypothetical protein